MFTVNIAKDFTRYPSGRYKKNGDTSGEAFREKFLEPHLGAGEAVTVEFDGTIGYGSSFLEEAFGGFVRKYRISPADLQKMLILKSSDPSIELEVRQYIEESYRSLKNS